MGALAWEQEPPKTHSVSRPFFDRGVGSSILASLSEAGGNDQHSSLSKPLPPRSQTCESRLSECVHDFLMVHAAGQSSVYTSSQNRLIFVDLPARLLIFLCTYKWRKSCFGRALSHLGNRPFLSKNFLTNLICGPSKVTIVISNDDALPFRFRFRTQFTPLVNPVFRASRVDLT